MKANCSFCEKESSFYSSSHEDSKKYFHCENCNLYFLVSSELLEIEDERQRYLLHENDALDPGYIRYLENSTELLRPRLQQDWCGLDYGCGPGPGMKECLSKKVDKIEQYDPIFFPEENLLKKQYDFITCIEVIEHFYHPKRELDFLNGLLKSNGLLQIRTEFYEPRIDMTTWYYAKDPTHVCFYNLKFFEYLEKNSNWKILDSNNKNQILLKKSNS